MNYNFTIKGICNFAANLFRNVGIDSPQLDAYLILGYLLKRSRIDLQINGDKYLDEAMVDQFFALVKRRLCFEPIAYIIERQEFFELDLHVSSSCLIPRPDTEVVVEKCLEILPSDKDLVFWDICTGSGAIALAILKNRPHVECFAGDISPDCLKIAKKNALNLGLMERLTLLCGDLLKPFRDVVRPHLIVSNPPYIAEGSFADIPTSVKDYEPHVALSGGLDGLEFYRRLLKESYALLRPKGFLVLEIGYDQADAIKAMVHDAWSNVQILQDLAGNNRVIVLQKA